MIKRCFERYWPLLVGLLVFAVGVIGSRCDKAEQVKVERDTVVVYDTIHHHYPKPVDSAVVRYVTKVLPVVRYDTVHHVIGVDDMIHDTVAVELPMMQKHYQSDTYQAWVSGYRPNLDSIEVYQKERTITETVTITQKAKTRHWGIGFTGGYGYDFNTKTAAPFVGVGLSYNLITF